MYKQFVRCASVAAAAALLLALAMGCPPRREEMPGLLCQAERAPFNEGCRGNQLVEGEGETSAEEESKPVQEGEKPKEGETPLIDLQLVKWGLETAPPNYVNILYQALGADNVGVTDLEQSNFRILEDGGVVSQTESNTEIRKQDRLPYTFYTVLMLDNSASVGANLPQIKTVAKALVGNMSAKQQIAVYSFSGDIQRIIDFTGIEGQQTLRDAIDGLQLGFPTTNLYGAVVDGVSKWSDRYQLSGVSQGALVLFTDGSDTSGLFSLQQALNARGSKRCYAIGQGDEINPAALESLGNAGYYPLADFSELTATFAHIQENIDRYTFSFYLLRYNSPKRGNFNRSLSLFAVPPYASNMITGDFNSRDFYYVMPGLYVDDGYDQPNGVSELVFTQGPGQRLTLNVHSHYGNTEIDLVYICDFAEDALVEVVSIDDGVIIVEALHHGETTLTVTDTVNGFSRTLNVVVWPIVPDVRDLPEAEAVAALEAAGLTVGEVIQRYSTDIAEGNSMGTTSVAGTAVAPGSPVDLIVATSELMIGAEMEIILPGDVPLALAWIPAGTFQMGRYAGELDSESDESPQHEVTLSQGFWMGKYEVTQAQYQAVMGANPSHFSGADKPVDNVSWNDAQAFITSLNAHIASTGQGPAAFRLPTEVEWEYAARAGTTTRFYWGDDPSYTEIGNNAWYTANSHHTTHSVGQRQPNAWGLYDMSGNVWEWCEDWYGTYPSGSVTDPMGPTSGSDRVNRGGGWLIIPWFCRSACRSWYPPDLGATFLGFRLAASPAARNNGRMSCNEQGDIPFRSERTGQTVEGAAGVVGHAGALIEFMCGDQKNGTVPAALVRKPAATQSPYAYL